MYCKAAGVTGSLVFISVNADESIRMDSEAYRSALFPVSDKSCKTDQKAVY